MTEALVSTMHSHRHTTVYGLTGNSLSITKFASVNGTLSHQYGEGNSIAKISIAREKWHERFQKQENGWNGLREFTFTVKYGF